MKVSINKPCHENWDTMTPNEQGSFCLSCQKTVIDFSAKTTQEIKYFFQNIASTEKVCGRFKEEQLTELTFDDFFLRFKNWVLPKKLAVIMFLAFGITLFSCQTTKQGPLMGDVAIENTIEEPMVTGKVAYIDTPEVITPEPINESPLKMGEVAVDPSLTSTVTPNQPDNIKHLLSEDVYVKGD